MSKSVEKQIWDSFSFNMLDSMISSVDRYDEKNDIELVLSTNKPDKYMEYFWLTFKGNIIDHVGEKNKKYIISFSKELDVLQTEEKYDEITKKISVFMNTHIDDICKYILRTNNHNLSMHLSTNIHRWIKNDPNFKQSIENLFSVKCVFVISKMYSKKNPHRKKIFDWIYKIFTCDNSIYNNECNMMFKYAVKHNLASVVDLLKQKINLEIYTDDKYFDRIYHNTKGYKLIKFLQKNKNINN